MKEKDKVFRIGITGGIGAGKTLVCEIFQRMGIPVYNADDRAKLLMVSDPGLADAIRFHFGPESYTNGLLNRQYLARHVFNDREKLALLNSLVHPAVRKDYETWAENQTAAFCLKEAALLFETGSFRDQHKNILVYAPEELRINRVLKRDPHRSAAEVKAIMDKQMDEEEKRKHADLVIVNDEKQLLLPQVLHVFELIKPEDKAPRIHE